MSRHPYTATLLPAISLTLSLLGCSEPRSPEQRVRALIENAERAAEQKQVRTLRGYVSERYRDEAGRDRGAIEAVLRLYLLRHEKIHLWTRIASVRLAPPRRADAVVYVAMAARPISAAEELATLRANFYRFEVGLVEEDRQWRVVDAAWRTAELADFLYQPDH